MGLIDRFRNWWNANKETQQRGIKIGTEKGIDVDWLGGRRIVNLARPELSWLEKKEKYKFFRFQHIL